MPQTCLFPKVVVQEVWILDGFGFDPHLVKWAVEWLIQVVLVNDAFPLSWIQQVSGFFGTAELRCFQDHFEDNIVAGNEWHAHWHTVHQCLNDCLTVLLPRHHFQELRGCLPFNFRALLRLHLFEVFLPGLLFAQGWIEKCGKFSDLRTKFFVLRGELAVVKITFPKVEHRFSSFLAELDFNLEKSLFLRVHFEP